MSPEQHLRLQGQGDRGPQEPRGFNIDDPERIWQLWYYLFFLISGDYVK